MITRQLIQQSWHYQIDIPCSICGNYMKIVEIDTYRRKIKLKCPLCGIEKQITYSK